MAVPDTTHVESRQRGRYPTGFPVRCTEVEKQEIFARAKRANRSASRFLVERGLSNGGNGIASLSAEEREVVEGLMVQLRRLASNLHELASREHAAADDDFEEPSSAEIDEAVIEVRELLDQLRSRLT